MSYKIIYRKSKLRRIVICISLFFIANCVFLPFGFADRGLKVQGKRYALVIGNGSYKAGPLKNPVSDAFDTATCLKKLGFSTILITNASQKTMEQSIFEFGKKLRSGGVGLFYYAGHGLQVNGRNYLVPVDAIIESESDVKYESVDAGRVLGKMEDAGNGLNIIILDACRNNPFARSFRSGQRGLAKMDAPTGSILAYSTAPGSVAADGTGRNGLYTSKLLKYMVIPGMPIEKIFKKVRIEVIKESASRQVPWESSSLTGDFCFSEAKIPIQPELEPSAATPITHQKINTRVKKKKIRVKVKQGYWKQSLLGKSWVPPEYEERWVEVEE